MTLDSKISDFVIKIARYLQNTSRLSVAFRFYMSAANCGVLREVASGAIVESGIPIHNCHIISMGKRL